MKMLNIPEKMEVLIRSAETGKPFFMNYAYGSSHLAYFNRGVLMVDEQPFQTQNINFILSDQILSIGILDDEPSLGVDMISKDMAFNFRKLDHFFRDDAIFEFHHSNQGNLIRPQYSFGTHNGVFNIEESSAGIRFPELANGLLGPILDSEATFRNFIRHSYSQSDFRLVSVCKSVENVLNGYGDQCVVVFPNSNDTFALINLSKCATLGVHLDSLISYDKNLGRISLKENVTKDIHLLDRDIYDLISENVDPEEISDRKEWNIVSEYYDQFKSFSIER